MSAARSWSCHAAARGCGNGSRCRVTRSRGAPSRSFRSRTMRCGALLADARHLAQRVEVFGGDRAADVVGSVHGEHGLREPRADAGGGLQRLEDLASRRRRRSRRASAPSRGPPARWRAPPDSPTRSLASVAGVHETASPTPPTSMTRRRARRRRPCRTRWRSPGTRLRQRPRRARRAAPRHRWQMARASASAASAGVGPAVEPEQPGHHGRHLRLVGAAAAGDGGLDLARRVQRDRADRAARPPRSPRRRPAPCPSRCARWPG